MTWQERIDRAKARTRTTWYGRLVSSPRFTAADKSLALDWGTCAVGEVLNVRGHAFEVHLDIEKGEQLVPDDRTLRTLGHSFYDAVLSDQIERAEQVYHSILAYANRVAPLTTPALFADQVIHEAMQRTGRTA